MYEEIECPYCEKINKVDTDEIHEEDTEYEEECEHCGKTYVIMCCYSVNYNSYKMEKDHAEE